MLAPVDDSNPPESIALEAWLSQLIQAGRSSHTLKAYRRDVIQFLTFLQAKHYTLADIERRMLNEFATQRLEQDAIAASSLQRELSAVRHFLGFLVAQGQLAHNPAQHFTITRPARPLPDMLDPEVLNQLLDQAPPTDRDAARLWIRDHAILELLYSSGLRVAELVQLNLTDIDFNRALVTVQGKGNKTRIVPIGRKAMQALQTWLPHRELWLLDTEPALFVSERLGTRLSTRTVERRVLVQAKRAGLAQHVYPHLLRHCFASHILASSGDLRAVQELLGHANLNTTQIYTHLDYAQLAKVYDTAHPRAKKN